ncbi:MAG: H(+)/Cl(-) exchange transporter ClcA [Armatimonadetes bacterium]|nr:H(+)/Cl(-) exchange transporter ClcA [Armatimonadota bacterium]
MNKGETGSRAERTRQRGTSSRGEAGTPERQAAVQAEKALSQERERRHLAHIRERRQVHFTRAGAVGLLAGAVAVAFQWALFSVDQVRIQALAWLHQRPAWGWTVLPVLAAVMAGLAGRLTRRFAPSAAGSGIPHVEAVLLRLRPLNWRRLLPVKFAGGLLSIGAGLSLGREGPTVQMGAAAGKALAHVLRVPRRSESHLIASGAGAGLAAAFNAPLAGFIFVLEELQRELSPLTYGTALISALAADIITRAFTGQLPSFHVSGYPAPPLGALPLAALVGVVCGLLGVAFNRGLLGTLRQFHNPRWLPVWAQPVAVGALAGLVAWWLPEAVGSGHQTAEHILRGQIAAPQVILALLAVKFGLTMVSYATGVPGGIFAPLLTLGALAGLLVGEAGARYVPGFTGAPAAFAVLGMGALFSAVVRAPLTGIVLIIEMTANYEQLFAVAVAALVAYLVAEHLREKPVYEALLEYDLHRSDQQPQEAGEPALVDLVVEPRSVMDGRRVRDLGLPPGCLLVTLKRGGREIVPGGDTLLQPGDQLVVIVAGEAMHAIPDLRRAARCALD